jgi:hypothetical protein
MFYMPSGVDSRLIISTGFPGMALSASMFDRLRGPGSAAAAPTTQLHFPDQADDGAMSQGLTVGTAMLGRAQVAALVLVARQNYLGACAEVARSRRQRRSPVASPRPIPGGNGATESCFLTDACAGGGDPSECDDFQRQWFTAPLLEIDDLVPIYILPDTAPILVGINADVRPASGTVDGILGTEFLRRVVGYIDYPQHRVSMRCVAGTGCLGYPTRVDSTKYDTNCGNDLLCALPKLVPADGGLSTPL